MSKTAFDAKRGTIFLLPPEQCLIAEDPSHPLYDPRVDLPVDEALVNSIARHGVIQPITIRKGEDGRAWVVIGRQRVRAAREVNRRRNGAIRVQVPCVVRQGEDIDLTAAMIAENELRRGDTPLVKARKAARLINMGYPEEYAAEAFGVTVTAMRGWLSLLSAPAPIRKAVDAGRISSNAAAQIAKLPTEQQEAKLAEVASQSTRNAGKTKAARGAVQAVKMRGRAEIEKRLSEGKLPPDYAAALRWVLRMEG